MYLFYLFRDTKNYNQTNNLGNLKELQVFSLLPRFRMINYSVMELINFLRK